MKLAVLALLVVALVLLYLLARGLGILGRAAPPAQWRVELDKDEQLTVVQLERAGSEPYVIGSVSIALPHWEFVERLEELKVEAQDKADVLNRRLP